MAKVGFLGLGKMGVGIAGRLLQAGHDVRVYNRTPSKAGALVDQGAVLATTAADAAEDAAFIFSMVSDDKASRAVWLGRHGALAAAPVEALVIECSTLSRDWVDQLSERVLAEGLSYLDCPVTGMPDAAAAGALTLFLGGDDKVVARAHPLLTVISTSQLHFGDIGAGTAYKLIVNLMGSIQIAALAEGLLVAERAGLDMSLVAQAIGSGAAASPQVIRNSVLMTAGVHDENILFNAALRLKDTQYGAMFARKLGQKTPLGDVAVDAFQKLVDGGYGDSSESKLIDILREACRADPICAN